MDRTSDFSEKPTTASSFRNRRVSPKYESNLNVRSSTTKSIYSGKMNRKYGQKSSRHKKRIAISQKSAREISDVKHLVNEFLSHKFSAAGVSYIARSRSKWRKLLWLSAVIVSISFMGYMTFNVIKEYLNFPKMLIREENITAKLQFPAVTLCSLNPIINISSNSSVYKLMELKELINRTDRQATNQYFRDKCYSHILCQWSWFNETCHCVENPCSTEFCIAENSTHCACSINVCNRLTFCNVSENPDRCLCSNSERHESKLRKQSLRERFDDIDGNDIDNSVYEIMKVIRQASTYDLVDIEEALMPSVVDLLQYGIKFDNLVISCSFDGTNCYRENFTVLYHSTYGRCYTFNYLGIKPNSENPVYSYNYGSSSGLRLILHVSKQESIDILNSEIGARVVVHDPYSLPFVGESGINVRPHDMSAIGVKRSLIKRLEPPYGNCVNDGTHLKFNLTAGQPYSILGCQKACRHHYLMNGCNCTKRTYIIGSVFYTKATETQFCKIENETELRCMSEVISKIEHGSILCDCRPPCLETLYSTTVSSSDLNENFYKAVKNIRTFHSENGTYKTIDATDTSNLMVGIKVYYSTFQVDCDKEQASYSWETLIANIGGNLGFFMGLTLVTFMEVLEFIWDIVVTSLRKYLESRTVVRKTVQMFPDQ